MNPNSRHHFVQHSSRRSRSASDPPASQPKRFRPDDGGCNNFSCPHCGNHDGRKSSPIHCNWNFWHPANSRLAVYGSDADDKSGGFSSDNSGDKKDDSDIDEGTLSFLKIFAPEEYERIQMKRLIKRDIIIERPDVQWIDIANQVKAKRLLKEAIILPLEKPNFFKHIRKPWKGVLMVGPPGTGKTMLAKAVATETNVTFFNVNISTLTSKFFGESEKLIKMLFIEAKARAPSVIFMDEIDSLCSVRGEHSEHECTRRMKAELLCHMDGIISSSNSDPSKSVVILGATNFPWNIDDAFLRRLEKRIYVPLPNSKGREDLLRLLLKDVDVDEDLDMELIADKLQGYSASDIVVVCRDAGFMAMREAIQGKTVEQIQAIPMRVLKKPITSQNFENAIDKCQKSVTENEITKFEEWNDIYGSSV